MGSDVIVLFTTEAYISGQVLNSLDSEGIYGVLVELTAVPVVAVVAAPPPRM